MFIMATVLYRFFIIHLTNYLLMDIQDIARILLTINNA